MVLTKIPYLHEVGGQLHYRRRVPDDLKGVIGKNEWKHALGLSKGQEVHAAKLVADYNFAYAGLIAQERVKQITGQPAFAPARPDVLAEEPKRAPQQASVKLTDAYVYDREAHGGERYEKIFQVSVDSIVLHLGDVNILTMTPKDVQVWIGKCADAGNKPSTTQRRVNALRALINRYFRDHEIEKKNPFSNPQIKDGSGSRTDRLPFNKDHLKRIDHYFAKAPKLTDDIRCLLTMLKLTGARPLEIGGLDADDVILDHDVPHIWIRNNAHRRIKTKGSERRIPLVGDALDTTRKQKLDHSKGALFSRTCHNTNSLSQRLNKLIRRAGVPKSPRLVVYSFRHTLEEAMRAAGVREHTQKRIMGHTDQSITGRYGAPSGMLEELRDAIRNAEPLLGKVDRSIYSETEKIQ